jgi:hypothetical protein
MGQRRQLVERWLHFTTSNGLEMSDESAVLFILAVPELSVQTQLAYAKAMSGTFRHLGWERQELLTLCTALRAHGAEIPARQAYSVPKNEMLQLAAYFRQQRQLMEELTVLIAWKSASRWGEVARLEVRDFLLVTPQEVIIAWGTLPKGRRSNPFKPSMFTVIVGDLTERIASLIGSAPREQPFCPIDTQALDAMTRRLPPPLSQITGHSFKKGAATHVVEMVATTGVQMDPRKLSLLLKHELTADLISASTLRYPQAGVGLARWLGTAEVTVLL